MAKSLKDQNVGRLLAVAVANLAIYLVILKSEAISAGDFQLLTKEIRDLIPAALGIALLSVANGLIDPQTKARLVFWRWANPMPGSRAFSVHAKRDPRIDLGSLERKLDGIPEDAGEQNSKWYKLYKTVETDAAVAHNLRDYLFTRDYTGLAALFFFSFSGLAIFQYGDLIKALLYNASLAVQYLILRHVATRYGHRFVTTVLAVKAAED